MDEAQAHLDVVDKDQGQEQMEIGHLEFKSERAKIREVHRRQGLLQAQRTRRFRQWKANLKVEEQKKQEALESEAAHAK